MPLPFLFFNNLKICCGKTQTLSQPMSFLCDLNRNILTHIDFTYVLRYNSIWTKVNLPQILKGSKSLYEINREYYR